MTRHFRNSFFHSTFIHIVHTKSSKIPNHFECRVTYYYVLGNKLFIAFTIVQTQLGLSCKWDDRMAGGIRPRIDQTYLDFFHQANWYYRCPILDWYFRLVFCCNTNVVVSNNRWIHISSSLVFFFPKEGYLKWVCVFIALPFFIYGE